MSQRDDDHRCTDRSAIQARRRLLIASALAGVAATQCDSPPFVCLSPAPRPDAGAVAPPVVCLAVPQTTDAQPGAEPGSDASGAEPDTGKSG
jgi:hypothetical protein